MIGGIVAPLSSGPVYFDYYPNFSVYVFDDHIKDIMQLQIQTSGFDMKKNKSNIYIQTRGCFRHTNTFYPIVLHAPSQDSKSSLIVLTDSKNQKIEHQVIKWEDLSLSELWVVNNPKPPSMQSITSANVK